MNSKYLLRCAVCGAVITSVGWVEGAHHLCHGTEPVEPIKHVLHPESTKIDSEAVNYESTISLATGSNMSMVSVRSVKLKEQNFFIWTVNDKLFS